MPPTRSVLFDLDDTLFDHSHATRHALAVLQAGEPALRAWTAAELERRHGELLEELHREVLSGRLSIEAAREVRFRRLLNAAASVGLARRRSAALARLYRQSYEEGWRAVPGANELLAALKQAGVSIVVVTNNLTAEQRAKLAGCGLDVHVDHLITSEDVGVMKPHARIFDVALAAAGVTAHEAVMIGDAWHIDVAGARAAGLRAVWLNRLGAASPDPSVPELRALEPLEEVHDVLFGKMEGPA